MLLNSRTRQVKRVNELYTVWRTTLSPIFPSLGHPAGFSCLLQTAIRGVLQIYYFLPGVYSCILLFNALVFSIDVLTVMRITRGGRAHIDKGGARRIGVELLILGVDDQKLGAWNTATEEQEEG